MAPITISQTQKTEITVPSRWKEMTPAFLFRGWKSESGGDSGLNTKSAVTPHAFYGSRGKPSDQPISKLPAAQIKSEIEGHLRGSLVKSHLSSWAADLQTALSFAGVSNSAHIAVFETSLRRKHNEIYHVPALREMGLTQDYYPDEYLVYGPVSGEAYTCVSVRRLRDLGLGMTVASRKGGTSKVSIKELRHAEKIAYEFRPRCDMDAKGPALFFTVFAAELGRLLRASHGSNCGAGWSQEDNKAILTYVSALNFVERAAKQPHKKPLVNPKTYVDGFPQLKAMVDILVTLDVKIDQRRTEISKQSSSRTLESPRSGKKRKADDTEVSKDPAKSRSHFVDPLEAQAQFLRAKFISIKEKPETVKLVPKRSALKDLSNPVASYCDELIKWAQDFDIELRRVDLSTMALRTSCSNMIATVQAVKARPPETHQHTSLVPTPYPLDKKDPLWGLTEEIKRKRKKKVVNGPSHKCRV